MLVDIKNIKQLNPGDIVFQYRNGLMDLEFSIINFYVVTKVWNKTIWPIETRFFDNPRHGCSFADFSMLKLVTSPLFRLCI